MSTRAAQIELLLDPLIDPLTGSLCSGYTAYFYAAGTSTPKNVWTEKEKTNPFTSYALDAGGKVKLYGDGIYKIVVENLSAAAVLTLDNIKIKASNYSVSSKSGTYTATPDDDVLICTGTWTLSLQAVANFEHALDILNVGSGTITVDPDSTETIGGSSTVSLEAGQRMRIVPDTSSSIWRRVDFSTDLNGTELILDADGDTSITADTDDQIDFKIGGSDKFRLTANGLLFVGGATKTSETWTITAGTKTFDMVLAYGRIYRLTYTYYRATYQLGMALRFNGDSGNNYTFMSHSVYDSGSGATSDPDNASEATDKIIVSGMANTVSDGWCSGEATIFLAANDNKAQVIFHDIRYDTDADYEYAAGAGQYSGASAITSVTLFQYNNTTDPMTGIACLERIC